MNTYTKNTLIVNENRIFKGGILIEDGYISQIIEGISNIEKPDINIIDGEDEKQTLTTSQKLQEWSRENIRKLETPPLIPRRLPQMGSEFILQTFDSNRSRHFQPNTQQLGSQL